MPLMALLTWRDAERYQCLSAAQRVAREASSAREPLALIAGPHQDLAAHMASISEPDEPAASEQVRVSQA